MSAAAPICVVCKRLRETTEKSWMACDAYPRGIPDAILESRVDHRKPYRGDHGLQFLAKNKAGDATAAEIIDAAKAPIEGRDEGGQRRTYET